MRSSPWNYNQVSILAKLWNSGNKILWKTKNFMAIILLVLIFDEFLEEEHLWEHIWVSWHFRGSLLLLCLNLGCKPKAMVATCLLMNLVAL